MSAAGLSGGYLYERFWKYLPVNKEIKKRWHRGAALLFIPFVISYGVVPMMFKVNPLYMSVVWYPSLGIGLALYGLYSERDSEYLAVRATFYVGVVITLTSLVFIPLSKLPVSDIVAALGLLAISMMLLIYLSAAVYIFFKAEKIIYGTCLLYTSPSPRDRG